MPGVFTYKASSPYDDVPGERYHFPQIYLSRVERLVGDWVAFHELKDRGRGANGYVSFALVERIDPDPARPDHFYARLSGAGTFAAPVPVHATHRPVEVGFNPQNAVRIIDEAAFRRLLELADIAGGEAAGDAFDETQTPFERPLAEMIRAKRAGWFRERVLAAYDRRCALTGMRLVNGGGAAEVEAAHIKSVADGGPDLVANGIALTRTVHWMFDRYLVTFDDDYRLIRSSLLSPEASAFLGNAFELRVPERTGDRPSRTFLAFHRERALEKERAARRL